MMQDQYADGICPVTDEMMEAAYLDLPEAERCRKIALRNRIAAIIDNQTSDYMRIEQSRLNSRERHILSLLRSMPSSESGISYVIAHALSQGSTGRFRHLVVELSEQIEDNEPLMIREIGAPAVTAIKNYCRPMLADYQLIAGCIRSSQTQLHLEQCRQMIEERMKRHPNGFVRALTLKNMLQHQQVQIQCFSNNE